MFSHLIGSCVLLTEHLPNLVGNFIIFELYITIYYLLNSSSHTTAYTYFYSYFSASFVISGFFLLPMLGHQSSFADF